jgi:peptidoglycan/LPS O-acetylase OafA/YrhL
MIRNTEMNHSAARYSKASFTTEMPFLNGLRGIASLLVVLSHARAFALVDYNELIYRPPGATAFYFISGLGHQSVMIFFVLSGFLITSSIIRDLNTNSWSIYWYLANRLFRLLSVLFPALILTLVADLAATKLFSGSEFYSGRLWSVFHSGPGSDGQGIDLSISTFLGNLFFLQTVAVPVYGSNGPLWSLSNEFWYYTLFPLFLIALFKIGSASEAKRFLSLLLISVGLFLLPIQLSMLGLVWSIGALAAWYTNVVRIRRPPGAIVVLSVAVLASGLLFSKWYGSDRIISEIIVGLGAGFLILVTSQNQSLPKWLSSVFSVLAAPSYSLYLVHFPVIGLIATALFSAQRMEYSAKGAALVGFYVLISVGVAFFVYHFSEKPSENYRKKFLINRQIISIKK